MRDSGLEREVSQKGVGRRDFLRLSVAGAGSSALALYGLGSLPACHSVKQYTLGHPGKAGSYHGGLKVGSYNIANARGDDPSFFARPSKRQVLSNLDDIISMAKKEDLDVLCMNEVDFCSLRTFRINQAKYIARGLGYDNVIENTIAGLGCLLSLGNAVVSRHPLRINGNVQFGKDFFGNVSHMFKGFIDFDVLLRDRNVNFVLTHLDAEKAVNRYDETVTIRNHVYWKKDGYVLLGDFNASPDTAEMKVLTGSGLVSNPYLGILTYRAGHPTESIDHILVSRGLSVSDYHSIEIKASDHRPIIGYISLR